MRFVWVAIYFIWKSALGRGPKGETSEKCGALLLPSVARLAYGVKSYAPSSTTEIHKRKLWPCSEWPCSTIQVSSFVHDLCVDLFSCGLHVVCM